MSWAADSMIKSPLTLYSFSSTGFREERSDYLFKSGCKINWYLVNSIFARKDSLFVIPVEAGIQSIFRMLGLPDPALSRG